MKSFILIFGTFLLSTSLFGGTFGITLSVEPENPIAGEEVTFTVNNLELVCKIANLGFEVEETGPTLDPGDGSEAITLSEVEGSYVGTHTYTTCLLYTSPSPRDLSTSRMPSSA